MAAPQRRTATSVFWKSPHDQTCSLSAIPDRDGALEVDVDNGAVIIHGRYCRHTTETKDKKAEQMDFSELEITVPLAQCQINWKLVKRKKEDEEVRSAYFKRA